MPYAAELCRSSVQTGGRPTLHSTSCQSSQRSRILPRSAARNSLDRIGLSEGRTSLAAGQSRNSDPKGGASFSKPAVGSWGALKQHVPTLLLRLPSSVDVHEIDIKSVGSLPNVAIVVHQGAIHAKGLYDAACDAIAWSGGRIAILVENRLDIALASKAAGIVLSGAADAPPLLSIKHMLDAGKASSRAPQHIIGVSVSSPSKSTEVTREGATFLTLDYGEAHNVLSQVRQAAGSVPVLVSLNEEEQVQDRPSSPFIVDGVVLPFHLWHRHDGIASLKSLLQSMKLQLPRGVFGEENIRLGSESSGKGPLPENGPWAVAELCQLFEQSAALVRDLDHDEVACFLERRLTYLLSEPPLVLVVGEFNTGKSALINRLLDKRLLAEGNLPTTNDVILLKHQDHNQELEVEEGLLVQAVDGCDLLRTLSIVDTPGTNAALDRQQRLAQGFIPRADLVIFVLSTERPCTESELRLIKYAQDWGRQLVYVLNKVDLLDSGNGEGGALTATLSFVRHMLQQTLQMADPVLLATSAKTGYGVPALRQLLEERAAADGCPVEGSDPSCSALKFQAALRSVEAVLWGPVSEAISAKHEQQEKSRLILARAAATVDGFEVRWLREAQAQKSLISSLVAARAAELEGMLAWKLRPANLPSLLCKALLAPRPQTGSSGSSRLDLKGLSNVTDASEDNQHKNNIPRLFWWGKTKNKGAAPIVPRTPVQTKGEGLMDILSSLLHGFYERLAEACAQECWTEVQACLLEDPSLATIVGSSTDGNAAPVVDSQGGGRELPGRDDPSDETAIVKSTSTRSADAGLLFPQIQNQSLSILPSMLQLVEREAERVTLSTLGIASTALVLGTFAVRVLPTIPEDAAAISLAALLAYLSMRSLTWQTKKARKRLLQSHQALTLAVCDQLERGARQHLSKFRARLACRFIDPATETILNQQVQLDRFSMQQDKLGNKVLELRRPRN